MRRWIAFVWLAVACSQPAPAPPRDPGQVAPPPTRTITVIGTSDVHGALERLPLLGGFVANVRATRAADGGGVLLVDGGDLFQGTLESNTAEGADVVRAYNQLGYTASAVGNHEFDFGPEGPAATAHAPTDDPRGALQARIREAKFPFLTSNIVDDHGKRLTWQNLAASTMVEVAGIKVGIVGASTAATPTTTMPSNFAGLQMIATAQAIAGEARALRDKGARVVVVIAHIGSACKDLDHPDDTSSCEQREELFGVLDQLPKGLVDVWVGGHTHAAVAHRIDGVAVIQSYSSGRAFGRVDLRLTGDKLDQATIYKPQLLCPLDKNHNPIPVATCHPEPYEGREVKPDPAVQTIVDQALQRAGARRAEKLGVTLAKTITASYAAESAEGDLFTDLMLAAQPTADIALTNGGGLRADLPAGELTYGQLFEAMPFDNRFALATITGQQLHDMIANNLGRAGAILSWAGLTVKARCTGATLDVTIQVRGKPLSLDARYSVVTSDFLAAGGDGMKNLASVKATDVIIRDAIADVLRAKKGTIEPPEHRIDYPGRRPVQCGAP